MCRYKILASLLFLSSFVYGQESSGSNVLLYSLIGLGIVLLIWAFLSLTDNLLQVEAKKRGADTKKQNFSLVPSFSELFSPKVPSYAKGDSFTRLYKGHNIFLEGEAPNSIGRTILPSRVAIRPTDYRGIAPIPKVVVKPGEEVLAGEELFYDKSDPEVKYVSPVSGEVVEIRRGAKRAITEIVVLVDKKQRYQQNEIIDIDSSSREEIVNYLATTGAWVSLIRRPFDIVPARDEEPRSIFISTFDTAPLEIPQDFIVEGNERQFQKGLDVLRKLTPGEVHLGLSANEKEAPHAAFVNAEGVKKHFFKGKHPAGNVGVQIHHIDSIKPGELVWTLTVNDVITIGELFISGTYKGDTVVGLVGSKFSEPHLIRTYKGANIGDLIKGRMVEGEKIRLISGDVLSGKTVTQDDFLAANSTILTAIKEGDYYELFGWLLPLKPRPSISSTYPNFLYPNHRFEGDTNTHGEKRAFVVTGQYEKVLPMKIYPQQLMKAIMTNDFEKMEGLGLAELSEEDVALCEFVCTSKMPLQSILRQGLEMMREQS